MQPACSIPPYDPEKLKNLIGLRCKVPVKSNPSKVWWVEITDVRFVSSKAAMALISGHTFFGSARWENVAALRFKNQCDDELGVAIIKGRENLTAADLRNRRRN